MPSQRCLFPSTPAVIEEGALPAVIETAQPPQLSAPKSLSPDAACRIVGYVTGEMVALLGVRVQVRVDRRRTLSHVRQVSMYLCHTALQIPQQDVGQAFGLCRTTVAHACAMVESRRDRTAYNDFVCAMERIVRSIFANSEITPDD